MQTRLGFLTNRDLFSNYYLKEHLTETDGWGRVGEKELGEAYEEILSLYEDEKGKFESYNESQLEKNFVRPVFEALGHVYEVEETVERGQRRPDYAVFADEEARADAVEGKDEGRDFYRNALSVADAKRWNLSLDKLSATGEKKRDFSNPSHQIHVYLQETPVDWAVLTNGRHWRIYYTGTSHKLDSYYDIDLEALLKDGDVERFKYFYLFFRNAAFVEDATGDCFLDKVYDGSNTYSQELGDDLQDNIYKAIKLLAEGFLSYPDNGIDADEQLDLIHDASLTYLYRLIFVLYAESEGRDLLDTSNEIYDENYSLNSLKREVVDGLEGGGASYKNWQDDLWHRLDELFELIDQGSESRGIPRDDLYVPAYNGGLFKTETEGADEESLFLQENKVGDSYLAEVVELLTRSDSGNGGGRVFVDYSSLDIRHLGSIYEGLLEYELNVADEPTVAVRDDGEDWMTRDEFEDDGYDENDVVERVDEGDVYLTTDKGERKATGSYYTPEYVVQYIVENTLDPILDGIREDLVAESQVGKEEGDPNFADRFAERVFDLKILDPAMGSGHFLTNAVDHLAREIIDAQEKQADEAGVETVDESHDIHWARRQVAQKCIYGVDLNGMAVELAKVSLWLRTLAAEQPLAFLDHHLKTGNSLVGSGLEEIEELEDTDGAQQATLRNYDEVRNRAIGDLMSLYADIMAIENEELADIKEMEAKYGEFEANKLRQRLEAIANVHTAEGFGVDVPDEAYGKMARALESDREWEDVETEDWFREARELAERENFFHWRLEYPEVFYDEGGDEKETAGFDAVVGNPPYVRQEQLQSVKPYFEETYDVYHGVADLYAYFFEKGIRLTTENGSFGYIVSNKFMQTNYGEPLREYLSTETRLRQIIDFGELPVFPEASTYPSIFVLDGTTPTDDDTVTVAKPDDLEFSDLGERANQVSYEVPHSTFGEDVWSLADTELTALLNRMESENQTLVEFLDDTLYRGIVTGLNKVFHIDSERREELIDADPDSEEIIEPLLKGDDVSRYEIEQNDRYLLFTRQGISIDEYPAVREHLESHKQKLIPEPEDYEGDDWEGRKSGEYEWYEIQDKIDHWKKFEQPKVVYPDISKGSNFALDTEGRYLANTCYFLPTDSGYVLGVLNSSLIDWYYRYITSEYRGGYQRSFTQAIKDVPVPSISFTLSDSERTSRVSSLMEEYEDYLTDSEPAPLPEKDDVAHDFLAELAERMTTFNQDRATLNLSLLDYLGISADDGVPDALEGETLGDLYMPPAGLSDSTVSKTAEEYEGLRVEGVNFEQDGARLVMSVDVSYKPDDEDPRETDTYGRLAEDEFETYDAMVFTGLSDEHEALVRNFVPVAVDEAGGFAGFRQTATKTNSLVDRLEDLTLPDVDATRDGLERYIDVKERADELDEKIGKTDALIDEIVYDLYGLTDEEIEIVEEAVEG